MSNQKRSLRCSKRILYSELSSSEEAEEVGQRARKDQKLENFSESSDMLSMPSKSTVSGYFSSQDNYESSSSESYSDSGSDSSESDSGSDWAAGKRRMLTKSKTTYSVDWPMLSWRWKRNTEENPVREFFTKLQGKSHWECKWLSEKTVFNPESKISRAGVRNSFDLDTEPELVAMDMNADFIKRIESYALGFDMFSSEIKEKFYDHGVHAEWLIVQKVLRHRQKGKRTEYLVKWRNLDYTKCTWEVKTSKIPGMKAAIHYYWSHYNHCLGIEDSEPVQNDKNYPTFYVPPTEQTSDLSVPLEGQPRCVEEIGKDLKLHEYQLDGINWLRSQFSQRIPSILGDEMGLGKTIQTLVFLNSIYKEGHSKGPFLIVGPLSTVTNWERETELWAPDFYSFTYITRKEIANFSVKHEVSFERGTYSRLQKVKTENLRFQVLITSYEAIWKDFRFLSSFKWEVIVIDEGHRLKNDEAKFFNFLSRYNKDAYKLILTGTPLQNSIQELFCLMNYLKPEEFDNVDNFLAEFEDVEKKDQINKLHNMLGMYMLRRVKADVLKGKIPPKAELIVRIELSQEQKRLYRCILNKETDQLNTENRRMCGAFSAAGALMHLRKLCNHPYIFPRPAEEAPKNKNGVYKQKALVAACGKFKVLQKMLIKLKKRGHRVLLFSQMTRMLDIIEHFLENSGYGYERIDGNITGALRQQAIDRFNSGNSESFLFLLSTRAGGLGINLATADTIIIYDSDWNPHNDIQAFSRAHRIGQRKKVMIYRFVCRATVEERMIEVTKKKMMLTHLVVRADARETEKVFSLKEMEEIIRFGTEKLFAEDEAEEISYDDDAIDGKSF